MPGMKVVVDLGNVELPPEAAKQLEADLRATVLAALGRLDLRQDFSVVAHPNFPPGTIGLVLRSSKEPSDVRRK